MANEHDDNKQDHDQFHEDGEYHFADDNAHYEIEADHPVETAATAETATPATDSAANKLLEKLKEHKIIVGIVAFILLWFIIYQVLAPNKSSKVKVVETQSTVKYNNKVNQAVKNDLAALPENSAQSAKPFIAAPPPAKPDFPVVEKPLIATAVVNPPVTEQANSILSRIAAVEQQNTANTMLQAQATQKLADATAQNDEMRNRIQELNTRLSNLEVSLREVTVLLQNSQKAAQRSANLQQNTNNNTDVMPPAPTPMAAAPKSIYTVQAIIPGRAWLKADSGDTVTVAEGDVLKDFVRITKIDPYDGVVEIDTGSKVITLSYGGSDD
jgi:hypothetical protein